MNRRNKWNQIVPAVVMKVVIQMKKKLIIIQENQGRKPSTRQADHYKAKGQRPEPEANLKLPRKVKVTAQKGNLLWKHGRMGLQRLQRMTITLKMKMP